MNPSTRLWDRVVTLVVTTVLHGAMITPLYRHTSRSTSVFLQELELESHEHIEYRNALQTLNRLRKNTSCVRPKRPSQLNADNWHADRATPRDDYSGSVPLPSVTNPPSQPG